MVFFVVVQETFLLLAQDYLDVMDQIISIMTCSTVYCPRVMCTASSIQ